MIEEKRRVWRECVYRECACVWGEAGIYVLRAVRIASVAADVSSGVPSPTRDRVAFTVRPSWACRASHSSSHYSSTWSMHSSSHPHQPPSHRIHGCRSPQ